MVAEAAAAGLGAEGSWMPFSAPHPSCPPFAPSRPTAQDAGSGNPWPQGHHQALREGGGGMVVWGDAGLSCG